MNDTISVLIPVFNREKYIGEAIQSVLTQTYKELDIIVYDDGSTDNSVNIVKKLMKDDNRIRLIEGIENRGVGRARNELLKTCNTKYACWQDSDDIAHKNKIELQAERKERGIIFTRWVWLYKMGKQWKERIKNSDSPGFATTMFPVDKSILFDETKILGGEDWDFMKKMQEKYNTEEIKDTVLYYVRFHEDRIGSWKRKTRFNKEFPKEILKKSYKEIIEYYKEHYE